MSDRTWMRSIMDDVSMNPVGTHGSIEVTVSGTVLTPPAGAQKLLFQPGNGTVRLMLNGTATSTNGFLFVGGAVPYSVMLGPDSAPSFAATTGTVSFFYQWVN